MIGSIFRFIGGFIAVTVLILIGLSASKGSPSMETANKNVLARAYLEKNKDYFGACSNSVGARGGLVISGVTSTKIQEGYSYENVAAIGQDFIAQVNEQCEKPINEYEKNYAVWEQTDQEIAKATQSLLDKLLKNSPETNATSSLNPYNPNMLRITGDLIFTEAEVEAYFSAKL